MRAHQLQMIYSTADSEAATTAARPSHQLSLMSLYTQKDIISLCTLALFTQEEIDSLEIESHQASHTDQATTWRERAI